MRGVAVCAQQTGVEQMRPDGFLPLSNHSVLGMPRIPQALCHKLSHLRIFLL